MRVSASVMEVWHTSVEQHEGSSTLKAGYTLAIKLNSTRSTLLKVDRVALAPYTLVTKSTVSATKSTAISCRIQVVADLLPKPATKSTVSATVDFVADLLPVSATVDFQQSRPYRQQSRP